MTNGPRRSTRTKTEAPAPAPAKAPASKRAADGEATKAPAKRGKKKDAEDEPAAAEPAEEGAAAAAAAPAEEDPPAEPVGAAAVSTDPAAAAAAASATTAAARAEAEGGAAAEEEKEEAEEGDEGMETGKGSALKVGAPAPAFSALDETGEEVTLASVTGRFCCLFFYPKDNTPGCTKEACRFRDLAAEFEAANCAVFGVSADHAASHGKFKTKFNLTFPLLVDTDRKLIKLFGAHKAGNKIQRSSVLIGKEGKIAALWNPVKGAETHPNEVLAKVKELA